MGRIIFYGGEHEIRTHGSFHYATFPRWCLKPLGQLSKVTSIILLIFKEMSTTNCIFFAIFLADDTQLRVGNIQRIESSAWKTR